MKNDMNDFGEVWKCSLCIRLEKYVEKYFGKRKRNTDTIMFENMSLRITRTYMHIFNESQNIKRFYDRQIG